MRFLLNGEEHEGRLGIVPGLTWDDCPVLVVNGCVIWDYDMIIGRVKCIEATEREFQILRKYGYGKMKCAPRKVKGK